MPEASRMGDKANCPSDSHGNICCPHDVTGPAVTGSPDTFINKHAALRLTDTGQHSSCCGSNTWECVAGSGSVFINGLPAVRKGDATKHCGGDGKMIEGSGDVFIGD